MAEDTISDGVTLRDILARLWRDRGYVIALPILGLLLGLGLMAYARFDIRRPAVYYITLNNINNPDDLKPEKIERGVITLPNSGNTKYPNGTAFQPSDIISPPVLSRLKSALQLPDGVTLEGNIRVDFDSPQAEAITRIYRDRLQARNLTQVDIEALNQAFTKQLDAALSRSVRIEVNYAAMGLDEAQGMAVARELPKAWTDVYTRQFRTLVPTELSAAIPQAAISDFENPTGVLSVDSRLSEIQRGLKIIADDNRLGAVQDTQGNTAADLAERANLYSDVYFAPVFASSVGSDSLVSNIFLRDQGLRVEQFKRQIAGIDEAISRLQAFSSGSVMATPTAPAGTSNQPMFQLDSSALSQIVGLSQRASSVEYLRTLLDTRQQVTEDLSAIQRKIDLARLPPELSGIQANKALEQQANDGFNELVARYNEILYAARQRAEDRSGVLYQPMTSPFIQGDLIDINYLALAAALAIAGLLLASIYAILRGPVERVERRKA